MKNTIWITGADGRLGSVLVKLLKTNKKYLVIGTDKEVDITDMKALEKAAGIYRPDIIINCASLSDANYCEENRIEAYQVNALGARNVATVARQQNAKIIHISTDDVFCGVNDRAKNEFDFPTPSSIYGMSKLAGENMVASLTPKHLIIRSSWVYGFGDNDYFSKVCEYGKNNQKFTASVDKISTPTSVDELSKFIETILECDEYGIMHASCEGMCSRYQYASMILYLMGYDPTLVQGVFASEKGARTSTVLENLMLKMTGIHEMAPWENAMKAYIEKVKKEGK